jgi:hypothetical protein
MAEYKWEEILRNCIKANKIKAVHLQHIPQLKTCDNWEDTRFLGRVNHKFKLTTYNGGLIKLSGRIYYINIRQIQAISYLIRWDTTNIIKVVD